MPKNSQIIFSLLLITVYSLIAYCLLIPLLGFYSDDWFLAYVGYFYGPQGLINSLSIDRPFGGYLYALSYPLFGNNILLWHIYTFFLRLFAGYTLFFVLLKIWPKNLKIITLLSLFFLIYPGFLQQPTPLGYQTYSIGLLLWIVSAGFTVSAIKSTSQFKLFVFTLVAVILQFLTLLNLEFFVGMEVLRLLFIIYILRIEIVNASSLKIILIKLKKKFIYCIPYIATLALFILWRIFIFKSIRDETDINWVAQTYYSNFEFILKIPLEIIQSFLHTVIFAFFIPIVINFLRNPVETSAISILIGILTTPLIYLYYKAVQNSKDDKKVGKTLLLIGLVSTVAALIPIIISGRMVRPFLVYDRYTITSIISVACILVGLAFYKIPNRARLFFLMFILLLSITSHIMNGFYRAEYWNKQKDLWWQLYWRAPQIKDNAMLILDFPKVTEDIPFKDVINKVQWYRFYWAEEQIWTAGNLFFNYNNPPNYHFRGDFLQDKNVLEKIKKGSVETFNNRNIIYNRDFNNTVVISTPSDTSCLWVLDKNIDELPLSASERLESSRMYSDTNKLIQKGYTPITPPKQIFGEEPAHGWCYYFQKASLARQLKDWDKLSQLKREVTKKNLRPKDPNEWLPFQENMK